MLVKIPPGAEERSFVERVLRILFFGDFGLRSLGVLFGFLGGCVVVDAGCCCSCSSYSSSYVFLLLLVAAAVVVSFFWGRQ